MSPVYDFKTSTRQEEWVAIDPKPILLVEGIFGLYDEKLRNLYDLKIFVHAD